jgi:hypothetical protein
MRPHHMSGALSLYVITTSTYYFIPFLGSTVTTTAITWHYQATKKVSEQLVVSEVASCGM